MPTYLYSCPSCQRIFEKYRNNYNPQPIEPCPFGHPARRVFTAPHIAVSQSGAEWLNEVANGYGDPPAGLTREQGMVAARAKARSDKLMAHQSGKVHPTISTPSHPAAQPHINLD